MIVSGKEKSVAVRVLFCLAVAVVVMPIQSLAQAGPDTNTCELPPESEQVIETPLYEALLVPGRAQFKAGQRGKGSFLTTIAFVSVLSFGGTQWLYARQTEQASSLQERYLTDVDKLFPLADFADADGYVTNWSVYRDWKNAYDDAQKMRTYRMYALLGVGVIYLVNAVDVYFGRPTGRHLTPMISCRPGTEVCVVGGRLEF